MQTVTLFTRKDCGLCDQARADLDSLQQEIPHQLVEIDIESDPSLLKSYLAEIPVVEAGPYRLTAPFGLPELRMTLGAARDRRGHLEQLSDPEYLRRTENARSLSGADRFSLWVSRHYLWLIFLLFFFYVGLPLLAPALMKANLRTPAKIIYTVYSPLCHQLGFRSLYLFGPQAFYPRAAAASEGMQTFEQATGVSEEDLWAARQYLGSEQVGYKTALCARDVAIYGAIVLFIIIYGLTGRRLKPLHWMLWLLLGIAPIGLDGFSQLFSQIGIPALNEIIPYRESTPFLRLFTGALFGFMTAWFGLPYVEESMQETRQLLVKKVRVITQTNSK
ncbi:MAG: DUF2085 domain-containing protein [Anaerolineales bacterium]|nr:DUF2085 domain-containing protein [Anaerolineales bacterium]